jgi:endoglucanase
LVVVGLAVVNRSDSDERDRSANADNESGSSASAAFFASYVSHDGRVVRHDEGGDTVSEGQAYALLLAVAANERARFDLVWSWTRENLQRSDGLFSWRWRAGRVDDANPAADADLDIAASLLMGASKFGDQSLAVEARRIATAVIENETVEVAQQRILVAGPWAVGNRVVNPSYLARCDFDEFEQATTDPRWAQIRESSHALISALIREGLPPDWIIVDEQGVGHPIDGPDVRHGAGRYGLDAARVAARLAGCNDGRPVAAALWARLKSLERDGAAISYATDGRRLADAEHPLGVVATALAAQAAGDESEATRRMQVAQQLEDRHSTYYGSAWLALGANTMTSDGGSSAPRGAPRVGGLRFAALGAAAQGTSITSTTSASPTPTSTSTTTRPTTTRATSTTTRPTTTRATSTTTRPTTTRATTSRPPTTTRPVPSSTVDSPTPPEDAGDLSAPPAILPGLPPRQGPPAVDTAGAQESTRRRTGALAIGGLSAAALLGVWLGLRERHIIRNLAARSPESPGG